MAIVDVDETGRALPTCKQVTICGELRKMGESDDCINRWCKENDIVNKLVFHEITFNLLVVDGNKLCFLNYIASKVITKFLCKSS